MTSLPVTFLTSHPFAMGELVCVENGDGVPCSSGLGCVGVAFKVTSFMTSPNGRQYFATNGPAYYDLDYYVYGEDLLSDFSEENFNYSLFNPLTDSNVVTAISYGFAPVAKNFTQYIQDRWLLIKEGVEFDHYLVEPFWPFPSSL